MTKSPPLRIRRGRPVPFGPTPVPGGVNFAVSSTHADFCSLTLTRIGEHEPCAEIEFPKEFKVGHVWCMVVEGVDPALHEYAYRIDGPCDPAKGRLYDRTKLLVDPYAPLLSGRELWRAPRRSANYSRYRGRFGLAPFDWDDDPHPRRKSEDLVIYECHLRGFSAHKSSGARDPGTYEGFIEMLPHLKELGVNCVELMPIFEFDELENPRQNPLTGETLVNYWGYSTVGFYSPKWSYAAGPAPDSALKNLVKELHKHDMLVVLDVVFNHTAEGNLQGPVISFKGIDNSTYYLLNPDGSYLDFSGCGNTMNCNHPRVRDMILNCLRFWVAEYHVDGFRFDLASILARDSNGEPLAEPPLIEALARDAVLASSILIAEAWDAGGLYQVGGFPGFGRFEEWNGKYRDDVRRFLKGDTGLVGAIFERVDGSPDLYRTRGPQASVNFIACHDGFTLADLYSYNEKHNLANAEDNRDGGNDNHAWNCGAEGETDDKNILALRKRLAKNALATLFLSRGVPMLNMGDEMGRTQLGNNNAYCQDNEVSWLDWTLKKKNAELFRFTRLMIAFRKAHPALYKGGFASLDPDASSAVGPVMTRHGVKPFEPDYGHDSRSLAFMVEGRDEAGKIDVVYVAMNMFWEPLVFQPPVAPCNLPWRRAVDTAKPAPADVHDPGLEPVLGREPLLLLKPRSIVVITASEGLCPPLHP